MNWLLFVAGVLAFGTVIGHFTMGIGSFLKPMLCAAFDGIPKRSMQCVFHYLSVFVILAALALLLLAFNSVAAAQNVWLIRFIGANYLLFGIVQVYYAATLGIPKVYSKMFQFLFFFLIGIFAIWSVAGV